MPPKSRNPKRTPSDEDLHKAGVAIKRMRLNQSKSVLALAKKIDDLHQAYETPNVVSLLRDCGMSSDEVATYMLIWRKLGHYKNRIRSQCLGYESIRSLVFADNEAIKQAMDLGAAGGAVGAYEIARLRDIPERIKISDGEAVSKLRHECFKAECTRLAEERERSFTALAMELYFSMETYENTAKYARRYYRMAENYKFLAKLSDKGSAALEQMGAVVRAFEESFFSEQEKKIITLAKDLQKDFDELFPGRAIPISEWGFVGIANPTLRCFAEARHALVCLQFGGFAGGFPSDASEHHQWDAVSSVAYLAGIHNFSALSQRFSPRPVVKLNAFIVRAVSGVEAVGLNAAGFRIRAAYTSMPPGRPIGRSMTPAGRERVVTYTNSGPSDVPFEPLVLKQRGKRNFPNPWNLRCSEIEGAGIHSHVKAEISRLGAQDVHLLAATLTDQPFKERGKGEDDERQQFGHAFQLLRDIAPKAFFFETASEFRGPKHLPLRNRLAREADDLGYVIADFHLNAQSFGVPQDRPRSILLGVAKEYEARLRQPVLVNPVHRTVGDAIADVAFGHLPEIEAVPEELRTKDQIKYRNWALAWLGKHGDKPVLDTLSLIRGSSNAFDKWYKKGFNMSESYTVRPRLEDLHTNSLPLSLQILKRLQGIPDDWTFHGTEDEQRAQICETTPPVIYRVIGHIIHAAITGIDVDIDQAARQTLTSKSWKKASGFRSISESQNPARARALLWRDHCLQEVAGP